MLRLSETDAEAERRLYQIFGSCKGQILFFEGISTFGVFEAFPQSPRKQSPCDREICENLHFQGRCESAAFLRQLLLLGWDSVGGISGVRRLAGRCKSSRAEPKRGTVDDSQRISSRKSTEIVFFRGVVKTLRV